MLFSYLKVKVFWLVIDIYGTFKVGPPQTVDKSQTVGHPITELSVKKLVYVKVFPKPFKTYGFEVLGTVNVVKDGEHNFGSYTTLKILLLVTPLRVHFKHKLLVFPKGLSFDIVKEKGDA